MKNVLLLLSIMVTLMMTGNVVQAQSCPITSVQISSDTSCVFTTWLEGLGPIAKLNVLSIDVNGQTYFQNDTTTGSTIRYSLAVNDSTLSECDTAGSTDLFGSVIYTLFGGPDTCHFQGGTALANCPENVLISQGANCLLFEYPGGIFNTPVDSVVLNDSVYYRQDYDPSQPTTLFYLLEGATECDTADMSELLNDTLFVGGRTCTYEEGVLPIVILAFDYTSIDGGVDLAWKVNSDEPTQRLYLQKSYDGVDWSNVYDQAMELPGSGMFTTGHYTDRSLDQSRVYYRLFIEGYHGQGNYSKVLPVTMKDQVINNVFYQPQSRSIMIRAGKNFSGEMVLFNTQGQNILSQNVTLPQGGYVEVQVEGALPAGIYFVRFEDSRIPPAKLFIN